MKTIVDSNNVSKYLFADDVTISVSVDCTDISGGQTFCIVDMNSGNSSIVDGVSTPDDWYGGKYTCTAEGTWTAVEGWVDPRE